MIAIQFEARKIGLIAEYKKTQEHRDREFELANKCIALVQQKDQIDEEIDQIDANIISQQERHASQQQSFIDDQKRKGKNINNPTARWNSFERLGFTAVVRIDRESLSELHQNKSDPEFKFFLAEEASSYGFGRIKNFMGFG